MAKKSTQYQSYPRIDGFLDDLALVPHTSQVPAEQIRAMIYDAIEKASLKSSRALLSITSDATDDEIKGIYEKAGAKLFRYFAKYASDPAASARDYYNKHYSDVAREQFRLQSLQKARMNSAWRYQFFVVGCARATTRFNGVSDLGLDQADFNTSVDFADKSQQPLRLYVSVKNRSNTLGGQDWPKAIAGLEEIAKGDKNATGPYLCIFGIAMESGTRRIKFNSKTKEPHSFNTEVWLSDYFWPFFTNYSYEEVMMFFLGILMEMDDKPLVTEIQVPNEVIEAFGNRCQDAGLLNENGVFNDPERLVALFCGTLKLTKKRVSKKKKA